MEIKIEEIKILELLELKKQGFLRSNPEYQRGAVWKDAQQKKLIDSVFRKYPLPLFYLHHKKKTVAGMTSVSLEIIDGQQRTNALFKFSENDLKLYDPIKDDKVARFPDFIKQAACPWASCNYLSLSELLKEQFNNTTVLVAKVSTENEDEARDLFIRLQAGLPLSPQEKRDAWPGKFTEFILKTAGKGELYGGHEFFRRLVATSGTERGNNRQLCAQIAMLVFEKATHDNWTDISSSDLDDYYYRNLSFNLNSQEVVRFFQLLTTVVGIFNGFVGRPLKSHEAIHVILFVESLIDDYTNSWQPKFIVAFEEFRKAAAVGKKDKTGDYWYLYGAKTMTASSLGQTIQQRHSFFTARMFEFLQPVLKDKIRIYGEVEREIIYYRQNKNCAVCEEIINWTDLEIHHIDEHQFGGKTSLDNGVAVHKGCHPKGQAAIVFKNLWIERLTALSDSAPTEIRYSSNEIKNNSKSPSPPVVQWIKQIPELSNLPNITKWVHVCKHLKINVGGDSARRALQKWINIHKPNWPSVPGV